MDFKRTPNIEKEIAGRWNIPRGGVKAKKAKGTGSSGFGSSGVWPLARRLFVGNLLL